MAQAEVAHLSYDAPMRRLAGTIGANRPFSMLAESGGGRGRKKGMPDRSLESYMATTREVLAPGKKTPLQRGGTLPPGQYTCVYLAGHRTFHECIQLQMHSGTRSIHSPFSLHPIVHHRDGFFIHGRGPLGSDGCIVPLDEAERRRLNRAVRDFDGLVVLTVRGVPYLLPAENFDGTVT